MCFCAIVPPHINKEIAKNGTPTQRAKAIKSLTLSAKLGGQRDILSGMPSLMPPGIKYRTAYTARNRQRLPGALVRREGDGPTGDVSVDNAFDLSGSVYDFYKTVFNRNSLDGRGMRLDSSVHYGMGFSNAYFNGQGMVYGDGDGQTFGNFTQYIDVIAHELTHGVTQFTANLDYNAQSGAANEAVSDIFGSMVKQWTLGQTVDQADWLIGAGLLLDTKDDAALRSMKAPGTAYDDPLIGKDPQPATMDDYVVTDDDNGGTHINSGILNRCFYLTAMAIGGHSWEKAGNIWYLTLLRKLTPTSQFADVAMSTVQAAGELYGAGGTEQEAVKAAWDTVKVPWQPVAKTALLLSSH